MKFRASPRIPCFTYNGRFNHLHAQRFHFTTFLRKVQATEARASLNRGGSSSNSSSQGTTLFFPSFFTSLLERNCEYNFSLSCILCEVWPSLGMRTLMYSERSGMVTGVKTYKYSLPARCQVTTNNASDSEYLNSNSLDEFLILIYL